MADTLFSILHELILATKGMCPVIIITIYTQGNGAKKRLSNFLEVTWLINVRPRT